MRVLLIACILLPFALKAQLNVRFNSPQSYKISDWLGHTHKFTQRSNALWSDSDSINDEFYILHEISKPMELRVELSLAHKTSSANYTEIILSKDSTLSERFIIRFGGKDDRISLIYDSSDITRFLNESPSSITENSSWKCIVLLDGEHIHVSAHSIDADTTYIMACPNNSFQTFSYLGFNIHQSTSSFFGKHAFHALYAGPLVGDTSAPQITHLTLAKDSIAIYFNETISISKACLDMLDLEWKKIRKDDQGLTLFPKEKLSVDDLSIELFNICDSSNNCLDTSINIHVFFPDTPKYNDIVINEILFNPEPGGEDFIELYNRSDHIFDLSQLEFCRYTKGARSDHIKLPDSSAPFYPGQYFAFCSNIQELCATYNCKYGSSIISSKTPPMNNDDGKILLLFQNKIVDSFHYNEDMHLSLLASVEGVSLERVDPNQDTHYPSNWRSASSSSLYATPGYQNSHYLELKNTEGLKLMYQLISPDNDGFQDDLVINHNLPSDNYIANVYIFDIQGNLVDHPVNAQFIGAQGAIHYDMVDSSGSLLTAGNYIAYVEIIGLAGRVLKKKLAFTVASHY